MSNSSPEFEIESKNPWLEAKRALLLAPRMLRFVFLISFFVSFGLTSGGSVMVPFFSDEFGYTDVEANTLRAMMVVSYVVLSLLTGLIFDRIGMRNSFIVGGLLGVAGSILLTLAWDKEILVMTTVIVIPLSMAFMSPIVNIALNRLSFEANRRVIFVVAYLISNIGAALGLDFVDFIRERFVNLTSAPLYHDHQATAARIIFLVGAMSTLLASVIAAFGIEDIYVDAKGGVNKFKRVEAQHSKAESVRACCGCVVCEPNFKALAVFSFIMSPVMKLFSYWDNTFPKAATRELGDHAMFGSVKSVNAWMIVLLLIPHSHFTKRFSPMNKMIFGSLAAALSMLILCANASYTTYITAIVLFTLFGEMLFSPTANDFSTKFFVKGHEGIYSSLTGLYLVVPNFLGDVFSGWLLSTYCPREGERHCWMMWLIAGLSALITPLGLLLARKYLLKRLARKHGTDDIELTTGSAATDISEFTSVGASGANSGSVTFKIRDDLEADRANDDNDDIAFTPTVKK